MRRCLIYDSEAPTCPATGHRCQLDCPPDEAPGLCAAAEHPDEEGYVNGPFVLLIAFLFFVGLILLSAYGPR